MQTTKDFQLCPDDRDALKRWLRWPTTPSGQTRRARILLLTTERVPIEATHWSTRLMVRYASVTQWQVRQVWRAADLKPHRLKTFKLSRDPQFAEKVIDVVGLYLHPPDNALVLSVDEKTQIQALDRTHPMLPLRPGQVARRTHDYKRHGTTNLYAAFNVATGEVLGRVTRRHRATEFRQFLAQIQRATPPDLALHLIVDNSSRHTTEAIRDFLAAHPRFHLHFTPTSASWLNAVETWFGQLEGLSRPLLIFASGGLCCDSMRPARWPPPPWLRERRGLRPTW